MALVQKDLFNSPYAGVFCSTNDKLTFYVKFGDYIGRIGLFVGIFYLLQLIVFIRINIKKEY